MTITRLQTLGFVWASLLTLCGALGESAPETLNRADQALASLQKVEYVVACYRVGDATYGDPSRKTIARVKQQRSADDELPYFWARVVVPRSNLVGESIQEIAYDGARLGVIDHVRKVCTHGTYEDAASNAGSFLSVVLFREFTQQGRARLTPGGGSVRLLGQEEVGGISCDVVEVIGPTGEVTRWSIGKDDHLPRKRRRISVMGGRETAVVQEIVSLDTSPAFGPEVFKFETPDGYVHRIDRGLKRLEFEKGGSGKSSLSYGVADEKYATELRKLCGLDKLCEGATSDLEKVRRVCAYVHGLWEHDGGGRPTQPDAISIVQEAGRGGRFSCVEYGTLVAACLNAIGIPARELSLMLPDVETSLIGGGHLAAEAWLADQKAWVFVDAQENVVPSIRQKALSAVEFQRALATRSQDLSLRGEAGEMGEPSRYPVALAESLYYFRARLDNKVGKNRAYTGALLLLPKGAEQPKVFQRWLPLQGDVATRSLEEFYAAPEGAVERQ
ncbi:MAG: transglutaminase domain-containing protein [Phycisphaeraceae bacterium]|nr:transglutaminase domain-containing protein [Phycisphaeraceae bacterium]